MHISALAITGQRPTRRARGVADIVSPACEAVGGITGSCGSRGGLISIAAAKDVPDGQGENTQIEPHRPVVDVVQIVLYPLAQVAAAAQIVHLRPTRDPRFHHVLLHVAWNLLPELGDELGTLGPWTDQRHAAVEHIEKLRKLVEAVASKQRAEPSRARI